MSTLCSAAILRTERFPRAPASRRDSIAADSHSVSTSGAPAVNVPSITLRIAQPHRESLGPDFTLHHRETDVGLVQRGPLGEDLPATVARLLCIGLIQLVVLTGVQRLVLLATQPDPGLSPFNPQLIKTR